MECRHVAGTAFDLCRPMRAGVSCHLLIDLTEPIDDAWRSLNRSRFTYINHPRATAPLLALLRMQDDNDPLVLESLHSAMAAADGASQAVRGWIYIADDEDLAAIAGRLGAWLSAREPDGGEALLRWYDPRVLEHLPAILSPAQWRRLRSGIRAWATLDRQGELAWAPEAEEDPPLSPSAPRLDAAKMQRLRRLEAVNTTLDLHVAAGGRADGPSRERADALVARFDEEYATGFPQDQVVFALHGLQIHPAFDRHPTVASLLSRAGREHAGLAQALGAVDAQTWRRVVAELESASNRSTPKQGCLE